MEIYHLHALEAALCQRLDERVNAELMERLTFADQFQVLEAGGTTQAVTITARMKE